MTDSGLYENRVFYQHGASCDGKSFTELNERGLKTCLDCAGIFDAEGKGIAVTDRRLDENYDEWKASPDGGGTRS